jgi:hypothetical protein
MTIDTTLALLIYKLACVCSGVMICFFGYLLFVRGIFTSAGDLDSQFHNTKLVLKKAAPGTFFALFGACVVAVTVWRGLEFRGPAGPAGGSVLSLSNATSPDPIHEKLMAALKSNEKLSPEELKTFEAYISQLELASQLGPPRAAGSNR